VSIQEFGFGQNDEGLGSKTRKFKAKEGEKYRISFAWWPGVEAEKPNLDAPTPKFIGAKRLYVQGVGYFLDNGPEYVKLAGGPSKQAVATVIIVWPTDSSGALDRAQFQSGHFKVFSWIFSADKYRLISSTHREFPLGMHDITVTCTDTQYQKLTVLPCRDNLLRMILSKNTDLAKSLMVQINDLVQNLPAELAQDLSLDQVRERMGKAGGGVSPTSSVTGGMGAAASADFDSMLDDIIK
jgi:hypothetical protein